MSAIKLKNKIYIVLIAIVLIVIAIVAILLINNSASRVVITNDKEEKVMNTNALTMMYETEAGSGEYQVSSDTTWPQEGYTFNERLSGCENGSELIWDDENKRVIMSTSVSDKCYVYFDRIPQTLTEVCIGGSNLASCLVEYNTLAGDGAEGLYYHDADLANGAQDNSYRYSGANPNNYVCFGSDAATCPADNLYRIIGIFNDTGEYQVKLIKYDYATTTQLGTDGNYSDTATGEGLPNTYYKGTVSSDNIGVYHWKQSDTYTWDESNLNKINLNINYVNSLKIEWSDLIDEHPWQIGEAMIIGSNITVKEVYEKEIESPEISTTYNAKIGLMYLSDYGYATSSESWNIEWIDIDYINNNINWMYMGFFDWTIAKLVTGKSGFFISLTGQLGFGATESSNFAVRPVFYLKSNVQYISGTA